MAKKKAPPLSRKQEGRILQILPPYRNEGLTASQIMSKLGNLREKSNIGQIRRFLDKNAHIRDLKNARGDPLYTKKPSYELDDPKGPITFIDMSSKAYDE